MELGPFEQAHVTDRAGYDVFVGVDGTIKTPGRELNIKDGYGVREHIITGQSNDPIANLPAPNWMWRLYTIQGDVKVNFFQPRDGLHLGFVAHGDEQVNFGAGAGKPDFQVTEKWEDPRTGMNLPVRWTLLMDRRRQGRCGDRGPQARVQLLAHCQRDPHVLLSAVNDERGHRASGWS